MRRVNVLPAIVAAGAVIWALALPAAAYAAARRDRPALQAFAFAVYGFGSAICHQREERSFRVAGVALPVCARCSGIYLGAAFAAAAAAIGAGRGSRSTIGGWRAARLLVLAALPGVATLAYEWTTGTIPSNPIRAVTGVILGGAAAYLLVTGVRAPTLPEHS